MEGAREFLEIVQKRGLAQGHFRGLLHILIGRRISRADGTVVSTGQTWRTAATLLRLVRWDPEAVRELGLSPEDLPPRDRQRYWYSAIQHAHVASPEAIQDAERLITKLAKVGYQVGPPPGA
jgi:hypothetical protein